MLRIVKIANNIEKACVFCGSEIERVSTLYLYLFTDYKKVVNSIKKGESIYKKVDKHCPRDVIVEIGVYDCVKKSFHRQIDFILPKSESIYHISMKHLAFRSLLEKYDMKDVFMEYKCGNCKYDIYNKKDNFIIEIGNISKNVRDSFKNFNFIINITEGYIDMLGDKRSAFEIYKYINKYINYYEKMLFISGYINVNTPRKHFVKIHTY